MIYRRIDDDFLDPLVFRKDSLLGVPGLVQCLPRRQRRPRQLHRHRHRRRQGHLRLRAADDQILPRPGPDPAERAHLPRRATTRTAATSSRISTSWSSKPPTNPAATACSWARRPPSEEIADFADRVKANPRNYIAQPVLALSRHPVFVDDTSKAATSTCAPTSSTATNPRRPRRPHPRGPAQRLPRRELLPGRRQQRHLGPLGRPHPRLLIS